MVKTIEQKHDKNASSRERRTKLGWFQRSVITRTSHAVSDSSSDDPSNTAAHTLSGTHTSVDVDSAASDHFQKPPQNAGEDSHASLQTENLLDSTVDEHSLTGSTGVESNGTKPSCLETSPNLTKSEILESLIDVMNNASLSDVTLLGRDGVQVRATRYVLACQSPAMQSILYQDPLQNEVFVGDFGEEPIRALTQYSVIGSLHRSPLTQTVSPETFLGLVEVASLATIYGFGDMYVDVDVYLNELIDISPRLLAQAYEAANLETPLVAKMLVKFIRERSPQLLLETGALKFIGVQRMEDLLNALMGTDGTRTFQYLRRWINEHGATEENMRFAREFASNMFCLESLLRDPNLLPSLKESGFFDAERMDRLIATTGSPSQDVPVDPLVVVDATTTAAAAASTTVPISPRCAPQPTSPQTTPIQGEFAASPTTPTTYASPDSTSQSDPETTTPPAAAEENNPSNSESNDSEPYLDGLVYQLLFDGSILVHTLETIESFEY